MGIGTKVRAAWQAGGVKGLDPGHPYPSWVPWWWMPQGAIDTSGVGDGSGNSAVHGLLSHKSRKFAEAIPRVYQRIEKQDEEVVAHPVETLLAHPNPYMVGELLWAYAVAAIDTEGDAYLYKARSAAGRVVELWPLIPTYVTPEGDDAALATADDKGKLIAYYDYHPRGVPVRIETSDIVHLRTALDPNDHRRGKSALKTVLREVLTDEEAAQFSASLLTNMGVPGVVISPKDLNDPGPSGPEAERMAATYKEKFGGTHRGEPFFVRGGAVDVQVVSMTPEQMSFKTLRRVPEERISSVLGVPAILAHLGAGLDHATYANAATLRETFTEDTLVPLWRIIGAELSGQLLSDFDTATNRKIVFDLTDVRALQADQDALWNRVNIGVGGGWTSVADAKRAVGLPAEPADEVYLRPVSTMEIPVGQDAGTVMQLEAQLAQSP